ncbi:hypothetical protein ACHWQZ_G008030 [Mnemiopsis leidyi]|jgi:hypothetical protein
MRLIVVLFVVLVVVSLAVGGKEEKAQKKCNKQIKKYQSCLKKGFPSKLGCESGSGELSKKDSKKCNKLEKKMKKCGLVCDQPEPLPEPEPEPEPEPQPPYNLECKRVGFDFWGADIRSFSSGSLEECATACSNEAGCKSFTLRNSDNYCWLKNKKGGATGPSPNAALTSMNMDCDLSDVDSSCKRENYDFWGADLRNFNSDSLDDCARHCRDTEDCQSFTLRKSDNYCWLKSKRGGQSGPSPNNDLISMNIDCSITVEAADRSCAMDGYDFWGADLRNFASGGFEACATACGDAADCKSFTLRKSDNYCWLKTKFGGQIGPSPNDALISRNMECDTSELDLSCARDGKDFWGADLRNYRSTSIQECARACRMAQDCQSFTLRKSDNYCWLKTKRGGQSGPSPNGALISMNIDCSPVFDKSSRTCAMDNFDFWGADLRNFGSAGYEDCNQSCFDAADCQSFTLRKSDNYCWLKTRAGGQNGPSANGALISRNMNC